MVIAVRRRSSCAALASVLALSLAAAGCTVPGAGPLPDVAIGGPPQVPPPADEAGLRAYAAEMAPRYAANPDDKAVALRYATALRGLTQHAQAVAVLQRLAAKNPHDLTVLGAYGKALADAGRLQEASDVLAHSHTPDDPNWRILSAQGSVADQMGNHTQAQAYYASALKIVPNQPQVLSNLGLSYALERQIPLAEETLRQAVAQPGADARVRQNLALVLSLEGRYADAEAISRRDLAPIDAADNVQSIKRMIADSDTWKAVKGREGSKSARKLAAPRQGDQTQMSQTQADQARPGRPTADRTRTAAADDQQ